MIASLSLALALSAPAAPIRPEAPPAAGPAPRVLDLKVGADGKVRITILRTQKMKIQGGGIGIGAPGGVPQAIPLEQEITTTNYVPVEIGELKDLVVTTVDGKEVSAGDAAKKLAEGGVVLASADGKKVDPKFLKLFRDDTLVLVSPELVNLPNVGGGFVKPGFRGRPGVIIGGGPAILPAVPAPEPAPAPIQDQQRDTNK